MKKILTTLSLICLLIITVASINARAFTGPVASNLGPIGAITGFVRRIYMPAVSPEGCAITYAIGTGPSHGTLSQLNSATGLVLYTSASGYAGTDSFTFTATAFTTGSCTTGSVTSSAATISLNVQNSRTTINGTLTNPDGSPMVGQAVWALAQTATTFDGFFIVGGSSVSRTLDSGGNYTVSLYSTIGLSPNTFYVLWIVNGASRQGPFYYNIPASTSPITQTTLAANQLYNLNGSQIQLATSDEVEAIAAQVNAITLSHSLLGSLHSDTATGSPTRGAIIVGNSANKWAAVPRGGAGTYVRTDGTDTGFSSILDGDLPGTMSSKTLNTTVLNSPTINGGIVAGIVTNTGGIIGGTYTSPTISGGTLSGTFLGTPVINCSACTGLGNPGGVINAGSTTIGADSGGSGTGVIDFQTHNGFSRATIQNNGDFTLKAPLILTGQTVPALSAAGFAKFYYDSGTHQVMLSTEGGAFAALTGGNQNLNTTGNSVHFFGDSLTDDAATTGPTDAAHRYTQLVANAQGWFGHYTDSGLAGSWVADQADAIYATIVPTTNSTQNFLLIGTNNERHSATAGSVQVFREGLEAELLWLGIPDALKIRANDSSVTKTGSWTLNSTYGGAMTLFATGTLSTLTFPPVLGDTVFIESPVSDGVTTNGVWSVTVDGVSKGTFNCIPAATVNTDFSRNYSPRTIIIDGLDFGAHTVVITAPATTGNNATIDWVAGNGGINSQSGPQVYAGLIPRANSTGYSTFGGSDANVALYNKNIRYVVDRLAGYGLNIALVDYFSSVDPSVDMYSDGLHIGNTGNAKMAAAVEDRVNAQARARDRQRVIPLTVVTADAATSVQAVSRLTVPAGWLTDNGNGSVTIAENAFPAKVLLPGAGCNNATAGPFWDLPTSNAASASCVTGTNTQKGVLDFSTASTAQTTLYLPLDFTGNIDVRIIWFTSSTSGNCKWLVSTAFTGDNASATDDPAFNTANTVTTAAPGSANQITNSSLTSITITGSGANKLMHLKIARDGSEASPITTGRLVAVEVTMRRSLP